MNAATACFYPWHTSIDCDAATQRNATEETVLLRYMSYMPPLPPTSGSSWGRKVSGAALCKARARRILGIYGANATQQGIRFGVPIQRNRDPKRYGDAAKRRARRPKLQMAASFPAPAKIQKGQNAHRAKIRAPEFQCRHTDPCGAILPE